MDRLLHHVNHCGVDHPPRGSKFPARREQINQRSQSVHSQGAFFARTLDINRIIHSEWSLRQ